MAKGRKVNGAPEAPSDKEIDNMGTYVKVEDAGLNIDLSQGFVKVAQGLFVREAFAGLVRQVKPGGGGVLGKGMKYVKPVNTKRLANYDIAVFVRALGTSGQLVSSTTVNGQRVVEHYNYLRPTAKYAGAVMQAVALAKELTDRGVPWTALAIVYPTPGTRLRRPRVLYVKGIRAYYRRIHTSAGTYYSPDVRLVFTKHVLGLRKETPYIFDLIVLYSSKPLQKAPSRLELVEKAMAQIPPPRIMVTPIQPQTRARVKQKAKVRAVEAQPAVVASTPQVQEAPPQPEAPTATTTVSPASGSTTLHQSVEAQPKPQAQPPQPAVQVPQVRPATLSTGRYVKQDLNFVKEVLSADTGEAFRLIRQRLAGKQAQGTRNYVVEAQPEAPTAQQVEGKRKFVSQVEPQPMATIRPLNELEQFAMDLAKNLNMTPEETANLIKEMRESTKKLKI